jgi:hypothetical protein
MKIDVEIFVHFGRLIDNIQLHSFTKLSPSVHKAVQTYQRS